MAEAWQVAFWRMFSLTCPLYTSNYRTSKLCFQDFAFPFGPSHSFSEVMHFSILPGFTDLKCYPDLGRNEGIQVVEGVPHFRFEKLEIKSGRWLQVLSKPTVCKLSSLLPQPCFPGCLGVWDLSGGFTRLRNHEQGALKLGPYRDLTEKLLSCLQKTCRTSWAPVAQHSLQNKGRAPSGYWSLHQTPLVQGPAACWDSARRVCFCLLFSLLTKGCKLFRNSGCLNVGQCDGGRPALGLLTLWCVLTCVHRDGGIRESWLKSSLALTAVTNLLWKWISAPHNKHCENHLVSRGLECFLVNMWLQVQILEVPYALSTIMVTLLAVILGAGFNFYPHCSQMCVSNTKRDSAPKSSLFEHYCSDMQAALGPQSDVSTDSRKGTSQTCLLLKKVSIRWIWDNPNY